MKVSILAALLPLCLSAPAFAILTTPVGSPDTLQPPITVNTCENFGVVTLDGVPILPFNPSGPDGVPLFSTGGVSVVAGDILFTDPANSFSVLDMYRIYDDGGGFGTTFSVFTLPGNPPADPFEHPFPPFNTNNANVPADQIYTVNQYGQLGSWSFIPCVPEPSTLPLLGLVVVPLTLGRRPKKARLAPVYCRSN